MERVIFFRRVILKRVSQVSGSRNIRERIDSHPNLWNKVAKKDLVKDYHRDMEEALGNKHGTPNQEKRHHNSSNLVLRGKLREAVCLI